MALTPRECRALTSLAYAAALRGIHASLKTDMKWARKIPHPVLRAIAIAGVVSYHAGLAIGASIAYRVALRDCDKPSPLILDLDGDGRRSRCSYLL